MANQALVQFHFSISQRKVCHLSQSLATVDAANEEGCVWREASAARSKFRATARSCPSGGASKRGCDSFRKGTICRKEDVSRHGFVLQVEDFTEKTDFKNGRSISSCGRAQEAR